MTTKVSLKMLQDITALRLLGKPSAGNGSPVEVPLGRGMAFDAGALATDAIRFLGTVNVGVYQTNATWTATNTLGVVPKYTIPFLKCVTANLNYSPGDRIQFRHSNDYYGSSQAGGVTLSETTTSILRLSAGTALPYIGNKTAGGQAIITAANWEIEYDFYG